jgi:hypothetical protein
MPAGIEERVFKVKVGSDGRVEVSQEPHGQANIPTHRLPDDPLPKQTITVLVKQLREGHFTSEAEYKCLGDHLHDYLLGRDIGKAIHDAIVSLTIPRVRIILEFAEKQQEMASWPWEYLRYPERYGSASSGYFLTSKQHVTLTRFLDLDQNARELLVDKPKLKVLLVVASTTDAGVESEGFIEQLRKLSDSRIQVVEFVEPHRKPEDPITMRDRATVTFDAFIERVIAEDPHILHFVGHGQCTESGGELAFVGNNFQSDWVRGEDFADRLEKIPSLRLVYLQACESALGNPYQAVSSVAMRLAHKNIPAVVAMQYKIKQSVASLFAQAFYEALAKPEPIGNAVQLARSKVIQQLRPSGVAQLAFGLPVLYLRYMGEPGLLPSKAEPGADTGAPGVGSNIPRSVTTGEPQAAAQPSQTNGDDQGPLAPGQLRSTGTGDPLYKPPIERSSENTPGTFTAQSIRSSVATITGRVCPWCSADAPADENFCNQCGGELVCPHCTAVVPEKRSFCGRCGNPLAGRKK